MTISFSAPGAAIWTPKRVVAASGGKILSAGEVFFVLSGLSACGEAGFDADFDAGGLAEQALQGEGTFRKKLEGFIEAIEEPLAQAAQVLHDTRPEEFKKRVAGRDALTAILFSLRSDELFLSQIGFKTKKRGKEVVLQVRQKDYPNPGTSMMSVEFVFAGADAATEAAFLKEATGQQALVHPEKTLQKFMDLAIAAEPGTAGYPLHLVKLAEAGAIHSTIEKP